MFCRLARASRLSCDMVHGSHDPLIYFSLDLSTTLKAEDKNVDFVTILKMKNLDSIIVYGGFGAKIWNNSTNEVILPPTHYSSL